jgi:hypothetical protein
MPHCPFTRIRRMHMNIERIELTSDVEVLEKLRRKQAEYKERYFFQAPEVYPLSTYKMTLLNELLEHGMIDVNERRERASKDDYYHAGSFDTAAKIIAAYNANELTMLRGGTGLR